MNDADDFTIQNAVFQSVDLSQLAHAAGWQAKFRLISQWGDQLTSCNWVRTHVNRVAGCTAETWLAHTMIAERHQFVFDSESRLIRGLGCAVLHLTNNKTTLEIDEPSILHTLREAGIQKHLSPSRNNGLRALIRGVIALKEEASKGHSSSNSA